MALNDGLTVIMRIPRGDNLGDAMSKLRYWLDGEKIQPTAKQHWMRGATRSTLASEAGRSPTHHGYILALLAAVGAWR